MLVKDEIYQQVCVFLLIFLVDECLCTVRDQLVDLSLSKHVHLHYEVLE